MTDPHRDLEEDILVLFQRAYRLGRLDLAEHLLRALEASSKTDDRLPERNGALAEAYRAVARIRTQRRHS